VAVEKSNTEDFTAEYTALSRKDRTRREAKLQKAYKKYLEKTVGHTVSRHKIKIDGQVLYTDLYDETTDDLIEVKSSNDRVTVRLALGQILDYARIIKPTHKTVVFPAKPVQGVVELLLDHQVCPVWQTADGEFAAEA
jgi:hypothetical protein